MRIDSGSIGRWQPVQLTGPAGKAGSPTFLFEETGGLVKHKTPIEADTRLTNAPLTSIVPRCKHLIGAQVTGCAVLGQPSRSPFIRGTPDINEASTQSDQASRNELAGQSGLSDACKRCELCMCASRFWSWRGKISKRLALTSPVASSLFVSTSSSTKDWDARDDQANGKSENIVAPNSINE
ncbi:hypothetical protein PHSY_006877 [Pseudozyma hubeiensis SY62]|uniref:Uncharacterized protein n=1 Tax=Pseudozyma hubeiensis (strain SY62) TaxID=1305764 RepID=R9PD49_PSEHS|nr:hypothetical protein PHSY_006877 [Pseudozyma hubeiensis SY62]GAC99276.1 hypothetical protein PHSY_006877 [Pseudozyma hubeiensis SY62]